MAEQKAIQDKGGFTFSPNLIKQRWQRTKQNPKAYAEFMLLTIKIVFIVLGVVLGFQFIKVIIGFNAGSGPYTMISRLVTFLVMVWVLYIMYKKSYLPIKERVMKYAQLKQYNATQIDSNIDTDKIIDETINYYDKGGK